MPNKACSGLWLGCAKFGVLSGNAKAANASRSAASLPAECIRKNIMETYNRYIIVANSGRGRRKAWKILDLHQLVLLPEVYDYKPSEECLALNKKKNGWTLIEHAPEENAAEQSVERMGESLA